MLDAVHDRVGQPLDGHVDIGSDDPVGENSGIERCARNRADDRVGRVAQRPLPPIITLRPFAGATDRHALVVARSWRPDCNRPVLVYPASVTQRTNTGDVVGSSHYCPRRFGWWSGGKHCAHKRGSHDDGFDQAPGGHASKKSG
jgi:hypothetical protein